VGVEHGAIRAEKNCISASCVPGNLGLARAPDDSWFKFFTWSFNIS
jgi:hypothetical protein